MPIYEYHCKKCHEDFEQFAPMGATALPACPKCKGGKTIKLMSRTIAHTPNAFALPGEQERPNAKGEKGKCNRCGE